MKPRRLQPLQAALVCSAFATLALSPFTAGAASSNWNVNADGVWNASGSWDVNGIPGSTSLLNSTDVATFGFALTASRIVTVDTNWNIGGITFSNPGAFGYTLSSGNLRLTNGGVIQISNLAANATFTNTISSPIEIQGDGGSATFASSGGSTSSILSIGAVTGVSTSGNVTTLTLNGSTGGTSAVTGIIGDGSAGGQLAITKSGAGTWALSGANTYSGKTTLRGGLLSVATINSVGTPAASSSLGKPTTVANGTIDLNGGGLTYTGAGETTDRVINLGGAGIGGGIDVEGTQDTTLKFTSNLTATGTGNKTLFLTNGTTATSGHTPQIAEFAGIISDGSGGGTTSVFKLGSSTSGWLLSGANTYTGKTSITGNSGPLKVTSINSVNGGTPLLASSSLGAPTTVANGTIDIYSGVLTYTGTGETTDRVINLAGTAGVPIIDASGTGLIKFTSNFTSTGNASKTLNIQGTGTGEIGGAIVDNNTALGTITSLSKNSSGTWTLSGPSTYTGKTSVLNGTLKVSSLNKVVGGSASSSLGAPVTVANGTIDLGNSNIGGILVYTGTGETTDRVINLAGATGNDTIDQSGTGLLKFTSNLTDTGLGLKGLVFQGSTAGTGEFAGTIVDNSVFNYTAVTKNGTGAWTLSGANTYTGGTTINAGTLTLAGVNTNNGLISVAAGTLAISGSGTFGASTTPITVNAGTVDLGGTSQTIGAVILSGAGATIQNGNLTGSSYTATNTTGTATVSASLQGSGIALNRTGSGGTLALTGNNTYSGATNVTAGTLSVSGASGAINSSSGYAVNGGTLTLDNTAASLERLNNGANVTLSLGGSLNLSGNSSTGTTETITNLGFDNGNSIVTITAPGTPVTTLAATGGLTRTNNATGLVRGTSLGQASSTVGMITLGTAPTGANFVGAGGSPTSTSGTTTKNLAIVPWLVGGNTTASNGTAFVTYDNTGGLRALVSGEQDTLSAAYATTGNNVAQSGTLTLTTTGHTFNSLFITGAVNLTGAGAGDSLTLNSGALATTSNTTITAFNSGITFGNGEGVITPVAGTLTIASSIGVTSSGGITKAGAGGLTLTGSHGYTGATTVNQGTLTLGNGTTDATLSSSGINTVTGATTAFANIGANTFSGPLSGGGSFTKTGAGLLTLAGSGAGTGTGAGTLTITVGGVKLNTATALQNTTASIGMVNALTFNTGQTPFTIGGLAGASALALQDTSAGAIALQVGNNNATTAYSGILSGGGSLVKIGTGTLTLSGVNTFTGGLTIKNGTVGTATSLNALGGSGTGAVTLGDSAANTNATLSLGLAGTWANPITLASTTTGILTIANGGNLVTVVGGNVTGTNNLTIDNRGSSAFTFTSVNNTGTITNAGLSIGATTVTTVGSNVSEIIENSTASALTLTTLNVKSTGTTLTNNSASGTKLTVTNSVAGTGNLIINNNNTTANGITLTGGANNTGTITNSGTGTGVLTVTGNIGSAVTSVVQNSANSALILSGTNTFGGLSILSGTVTGGGTTAATSLGSGTILLGNTSGSANATLLAGTGNNVAMVLSNPITVQAGNTGTQTIGNIVGANTVTYSGLLTLNHDVILDSSVVLVAGSNPAGTVNFSSLAGASAATITSSGLGTSSSGQSYGVSATNVTFTATNAGWSGDTRISSGALVLSSTASGSSNAWLGTGSNPVLIGDTTGVQSARLMLLDSTTGQTFSKDIRVEAGNGGISGIGSTSSTANSPTYTSAITLNKSAYLLGFDTFNGSILKGTGPGAVSITSQAQGNNGPSSLITLGGGTALTRTYDGGTTVGQGVLAAATGTTGNFGLGNVVVETGALRLTDVANVASGKKVYVGSLGQVTLGATGFTPANLATVLDSTSSGGIGIATGITYTSNLNLAVIGNGLMTLGNESLGAATYSGTALGANSDGDYRLGWGNNSATNSLTITNGVLVDGVSPVHAAKLIVGGTQGFIGAPLITQGIHTEGFVTLSAANTYTGGTVVNPRSRLVGQALTSGSPFGSSTGTMTLHNSFLQLTNSAALTTATTVGALDFDGASTIQVNGLTAGSNTLTIGAITRNANGTLIITTSGIGAVLGSTAFLKSSAGAPATFATVDAGTGGSSVAMLAPYYTDAVGNYLTYTANGFVPIATSWTTLGGATPTNAFVKTSTAGTSVGNSATYVDGSVTVGALSLGGGLLSSVIGDVTVTIGTGGLTGLAFSTGNASFNSGLAIGSAGNNHVNLDFNGKEAVIVSNANNQNGGMTIFNTISNTGGLGLTKSGAANLTLSGTNTFTGPVTINQGAISVAFDASLGDSGNGLVLNGGTFYSNNNGTTTLAATRSLTVGEAGGTLGIGSGTSANGLAFGTGNLTILGQVIGTGAFLNLISGNNALSSGLSNTFTFANTTNNFVAPIFVGITNFGRVNLAFSDDGQLGNSANTVTLMNGNSSLQYTAATSGSLAHGVVFADMGGSIEVVNAVTLTDSGTISGSGLFNKNGIGTLALSGSAATFSGTVNVNAGVLNVSNANALGATTAVISGSSGVSGGAAYVQSGAALEVQGNIALGNSGGKTLYLNGSGISNGGSLRNVSGTNSNSGAVILQSNTTIGADAGSLTLSGAVSGTGSSLTKVGAGTLVLSGANTFTGSTTISGGTLQLGSGSTTGSLSTTSAIVNNGNFTINRSNAVTQGTDFSSGAISGSGSFTQAGAGTTTLNAANTYTGLTTVSAGELDLNTTGGQAIAGNLTVSGGTAKLLQASQINSAKNLSVGGGTFNLQGFNQTVANVQLTGGTITGSGGTLTSTNAYDLQSGSVSAILAGGNGLTKSTGGTVTLTGANTYTGPTNVTGGTFRVNGSLANSTVTIGSGATLGGSGSFGGFTTIQSGGTLSPGNSPGIQTFSSGLTLSTGSNFSFELIANSSSGRGSNFDGVNVSGGTFTLQSGVTFNITLNGSGSSTDFSNPFWSSNQSWLVFQNSNAPSIVGSFVLGSVSNDALSQAFASTGGSFNFSQSGNDIYLTYTAAAIPEPSSFAALLAASALGFASLRRRRS